MAKCMVKGRGEGRGPGGQQQRGGVRARVAVGDGWAGSEAMESCLTLGRPTGRSSARLSQSRLNDMCRGIGTNYTRHSGDLAPAGERPLRRRPASARSIRCSRADNIYLGDAHRGPCFDSLVRLRIFDHAGSTWPREGRLSLSSTALRRPSPRTPVPTRATPVRLGSPRPAIQHFPGHIS